MAVMPLLWNRLSPILQTKTSLTSLLISLHCSR